MSRPRRYLLDTNILVHFVRQDAIWAKLRTRFNLLLADLTPVISIVSAGELRSLAIQNEWKSKKIDQMEFVLGYFPQIPLVDDGLVRAHATLDAGLMDRGLRLGKNDLWIAATTVFTDSFLLTTDKDFLTLIETGFPGERIDPSAP